MYTHTVLCLTALTIGTQSVPLPSQEVPPTHPASIQSLVANHEDLIPTLIATLADNNPHTVEAAFQALVGLGEQAVPALVKTIKNEMRSDAIRAQATSVVGQMTSHTYIPVEALPVLIDALKADNEEIRRAAAQAIRQIVVKSRERDIQQAGGLGGGFF